MAQRITNKDIESIQALLNQVLGRPLEYWDSENKRARPGHIHAKGINGHFNIYSTSNEGGGAGLIASGLTKRETYDWFKAAYKGAMLFQNRDTYCWV